MSFHTLRHSFASLLTADGMHARKLQEALAHSDSNLTARYSHLGSETMVEVPQRMAHLLASTAPTGSGNDRIEGYQRGTKPPSAASTGSTVFYPPFT